MSSSKEKMARMRSKLKLPGNEALREAYLKKGRENHRNFYAKKLKSKDSKDFLRKRAESCKRYRAKKKPTEDPPKDTGYTSRDSIYRKASQVQKMLPKKPVKIQQVLNHLNKINKIDAVAKKCQVDRNLSAENLEIIKFYARDDISVALPGVKDEKRVTLIDGSKVVVRKRILRDTIKSTYRYIYF